MTCCVFFFFQAEDGIRDAPLVTGVQTCALPIWFMDAALRHSASDQPIRLAIVQRGGGEWIGVLPLAQSPRFGRWPVPHWQSWLATNQFLGVPLVRPDAAHRFWAVLLDCLDARAGREILLQCRQLAQIGRAHV